MLIPSQHCRHHSLMNKYTANKNHQTMLTNGCLKFCVNLFMKLDRVNLLKDFYYAFLYCFLLTKEEFRDLHNLPDLARVTKCSDPLPPVLQLVTALQFYATGCYLVGDVDNIMLRSWNPNYSHADPERWVCIYPAYINSKKTIAEGRKVSKTKAVENPKFDEMKDILTTTGLNTLPENNKVYCRERDVLEARFRGRVKVQIKGDDGSTINENFPDRQSLMLFLCDTIPKLKSRQSQSGGASAAVAPELSNQKKNKKKKK